MVSFGRFALMEHTLHQLTERHQDGLLLSERISPTYREGVDEKEKDTVLRKSCVQLCEAKCDSLQSIVS